MHRGRAVAAEDCVPERVLVEEPGRPSEYVESVCE
jgi:hypothetical protein